MADNLPCIRWRLVVTVCLGSALAAAAGCQRSGPGKLLPVEGTVLYEGKPLTVGSVSFRPDAARGNTSTYEPAGSIDDQGHYQLVTAGKPGAPPGWYKVTVTAEELDANNLSAPPKKLIPARYGMPTTTELALEVVDNPRPEAYDLKLTR
jgi:hypothetical protein